MAKLYTLLFMLLLTQVATAQTPAPTSTPAPWPPDPNAIFAEGVQWEVVPPTMGIPTETPFASPTETTSPTLDPQRPMICAGQVAQDAPGEGRWRIVNPTIGNTKDAFFCQTETGEERHTVPDFADCDAYPPADKTLLLLECYDMENYHLYTYDFNVDVITPLGMINRGIDDSVSLCQWMTETVGVLCTHDIYRSWPGNRYYRFDLTQPDSLEFLFSGWNTDTFYDEPLKRYISIDDYDYSNSITGSASDPRPCVITLFDASGLEKYELGEKCLNVGTDSFFQLCTIALTIHSIFSFLGMMQTLLLSLVITLRRSHFRGLPGE